MKQYPSSMKNLFRTALLATVLALPALASAQSAAISRADFVINMMASKGLYGSGGNCFPDVTNQPFAPAVCEAKARGYVRGEGSGRFEPSKNVTLIDAAVMAMRLEGISLPSDSIWYRPAIEQLADWNAIPRSISSIVQPLSVQQANELLINVRNRRGSDSSSGHDDGIEHDDDNDDLTVSITESDTTVDPGDTVTYRIRIVNDDNDDVKIDVRAELDDDMIFVSATEDGEEDDDVVEWDNVRIDEDDDIVLQLRVRIRSNAHGNVVLRVEAEDEVDEEETTVRDDDDDNDDDEDDDDEDIELSVEDSSDRVQPGDTVTYRIRLENNGNSDEDVDVEAELDDDMIFVSASSGGDEDDDVVEWEDIEVREDETRTLLLTVRMRSSLDDGDTVKLRVKAAGHTETETTRIDDDADNDNDDDQDVDISITDVTDPVEEGEVITYRITVNNNENNPIRTDVTAFLDDETSFSSASDAGELHGGDEVRWENIDIARDGSKTLLLGVRPRSSVRDGDTVNLRVEAGDDEDTETTRIEENDDGEDVRVTITDSPDPAEPGETVTYRIRVENLDNDDTDVDIRAFLDDDMIFVSASNGGDEDDGEVEWNDLEIDGDDEVTLTLRVRIRSSADDGDRVRLRVEAGSDEDTETTNIED